MIFDNIGWREHNLDHATRRLTADEVHQAILNADKCSSILGTLQAARLPRAIQV